MKKSMDIIDFCDFLNKKSGRQQIIWYQITPQEDPDRYIGIDPRNKTFSGPDIHIGKKYSIIYKFPVKMSFFLPGQGNIIAHVVEITGTLINLFELSMVDCIICRPDDWSEKLNILAYRAAFRLFVGDKLEEIFLS